MTRRRDRGQVRGVSAGWVVLSVLAIAQGGRPASAQTQAADEPKARKEWSLRLGLDERYDDNIIQLSDRDLDRLANPRPTDAAANRFAIESPDDFITIPHLSPDFKADWWHGHPTSFGFDAFAYQYLRNPVKSYQSYRLTAAQVLRDGKALSTSLGVTYGLIPRYYTRNLISNRHLERLGFLPNPIPRFEVTYRKDYLQLEVEQDIVKEVLSLRAYCGREHRDYNPNFDERDSQMPYREGTLSWTPRRDGSVRLRAGYRREDLHAAGELADVPSFVEDDISSRRDIWDADIRLRWGEKGRRKSVTVDYEHERRDYSTTNVLDAFHFGRLDIRTYTTFALRVDLKKRWYFAAGAGRDTNRSTFPSAVGTTVPPEDITDYTENLLQIGFGYDFGEVVGRGVPGRRTPE
ncbi:MAG TPA: hypothetical protein VKF61_04270 [Candidatus Polarisedimenticolia bacterium]|nr:hypothetical protein [Candidatus Polarisedimenticolia bacterium]